MTGLGCQTQVIHPAAGDERGPVPCGHDHSSHRHSTFGPYSAKVTLGRCRVGGCGCPTYTPPEGHTPPPALDAPGPG